MSDSISTPPPKKKWNAHSMASEYAAFVGTSRELGAALVDELPRGKGERALTVRGEEKSRNRRDYRPTLEAAEALRLLSSASAGALFPGLAAEHELQAAPGQSAGTPVDDFVAVSNATWDAALVQVQLADLRCWPHAANGHDHEHRRSDGPLFRVDAAEQLPRPGLVSGRHPGPNA